jgi:hypothetical protein
MSHGHMRNVGLTALTMGKMGLMINNRIYEGISKDNEPTDMVRL